MLDPAQLALAGEQSQLPTGFGQRAAGILQLLPPDGQIVGMDDFFYQPGFFVELLRLISGDGETGWRHVREAAVEPAQVDTVGGKVGDEPVAGGGALQADMPEPEKQTKTAADQGWKEIAPGRKCEFGTTQNPLLHGRKDEKKQQPGQNGAEEKESGRFSGHGGMSSDGLT